MFTHSSGEVPPRWPVLVPSRNGSKGPAYDAQTIYKEWGFDLSDIEVHIEVFQGMARVVLK